MCDSESKIATARTILRGRKIVSAATERINASQASASVTAHVESAALLLPQRKTTSRNGVLITMVLTAPISIKTLISIETHI